VGTGKTTLARFFLSKLEPDTRTAVVLYPALTAAELLQAILDDLHVAAGGTSLKGLIDALHGFLLEARAAGRNVVLLIDEAQDLASEVLEQIRLISNLETDTEKLIQIILIGQSELREVLERHELRQLAQRITARYHLMPLSLPDTGEYVRHRLEVAGGAGKVTFTGDALRELHRRSGGVPRILNLLCDRALLAGYVAGSRTITAPMVRMASEEVAVARAGRTSRRRRALVPVALTLLLAALAFVATARLARAPATSGDAAATAVRHGSATAEPLAAGQPEDAAPADAALEDFLLTAERERSFAQASARVEAAWGARPVARTTLRTHFSQLRAIDLPAVLELFHPSRRDTCFVALVRLDQGSAVVAAGDRPDRVVPVRQIDEFWTRDAVVFWPEDEALRTDAARRTAWARPRLAARGYRGDLPDAVRRFQRDSRLVSDGLLGPRTRMALFAGDPGDRPRLSAREVRR
jgi:general secretion pathway protein A